MHDQLVENLYLLKINLSLFSIMETVSELPRHLDEYY